jgi:hypothetical protein
MNQRRQSVSIQIRPTLQFSANAAIQIANAAFPILRRKVATFRRKIDVVRDFGRWGDRKQSPPDG